MLKLEAKDLAVFKAIRLESLKMAPTAFANTFADWSSLSDEEWLDRMKIPVFVMLKGQEPVGIMGLMLQRGEKRSHRATIIMVYLRESERGSGLASDLLQAVMGFAKECGVRQLELNVNHTNVRAIRFYERHGFKMVGKIPAALIDDGHEVDELIMVLRVTLAPGPTVSVSNAVQPGAVFRHGTFEKSPGLHGAGLGLAKVARVAETQGITLDHVMTPDRATVTLRFAGDPSAASR